MKPTHWRRYLKTTEKSKMDQLETRARKLDAERAEITAQMNRIRNRAAHRAIYARKRSPYNVQRP